MESTTTTRTGRWVRVNDYEELDRALDLAKGSYQRDLLLGRENLSGSTLAGKARSSWGASYYESRRNLLTRLTDAGICWGETTAQHGAQILVIGEEIEQ